MMKPFSSIVLSLSLLLLCSCDKGASTGPNVTGLEGQEFVSLEALTQHPEFVNYTLGGRFGDAWPATVKKLVQAEDEITFSVNGRTHRYPDYTGYHLKVPILIGSDDQEMAFVFRSNTKP